MNRCIRWVSAFAAIAACGMLGACSQEPPQAAHTVDWYLAHKSDRAGAVERCANDPGTLGKTPDCVNAFAAAQRADLGSLRNLPPLGLTSAPMKPRAAPGVRGRESSR